MTDVILVILDQPATAGQTLAAAGILAGLCGGARLQVLAIRQPPEASLVPGEEMPTRRHAAFVDARELDRLAALEQAFAGWAPGRPAEWCAVEGPQVPLVEAWGSRADTIVLPRPAPDSGYGVLDTALFRCDRPVLLASPGPVAPFGRRVAIAWRDDRRAVKAVIAALRWLDRAERVDVLVGQAKDAPPPALPEILTEHGIRATVHRVATGSGPPGAALLEAALSLGADLLVAGAYAHGRLREALLGGVTRHLLAHAGLPLLIRH